MRKFRQPNREQALLMTYVDLNSAAPVGSAVRTINDLLDVFDTSGIEQTYNIDADRGNNPIHPKTIIKVCLYAIHSCRFSLRKMEQDTKYHMGYRWLTGNEHIDHSTFGKFLIRFKDELVDLFSQTVILSVEKELLNFEVLSIDSVKIRANASHKRDKTMAGLDKETAKIRKKIAEIIESADKEEQAASEREALHRQEARVEEAKEELRKRIECKAGKKLDKEKINLTDFDSHKMQQGNGEINPSYSMTLAVDTENDIITHFQINEEDNDAKALIPAIEGSGEKCGRSHDMTTADSGFATLENYEKLKKMEQESLIPDKRYEIDARGEQKRGAYDKSHFRYQKSGDCYLCPGGAALKLQTEFTANGRRYYRYANQTACFGCAHRGECTKGGYRTITRDAKESYLERMREHLSLPENKEIYKLRSHSSESPHGNMKHNMKYRIFMRRGRDKVSLEGSLLCMLHNVLKIGRYAVQNA